MDIGEIITWYVIICNILGFIISSIACAINENISGEDKFCIIMFFSAGGCVVPLIATILLVWAIPTYATKGIKYLLIDCWRWKS